MYGEHYYTHYSSDSGLPYERRPEWLGFFADVADGIITQFAPTSVLDVGCAKGFLVEALRNRGVQAWGIDVSEYAISEVDDSVRQYCAASGAEADLPGGFPARFELVTCIETLEHLPDDTLQPAIANLCRWSDRILFSSTPDDFAEVSHLNVQPPERWAAWFAAHGLVRDFDADPSFLTAWAVAYHRVPPTLPAVVSSYERAYFRASREAAEARRTAIEVTAEIDRRTDLVKPDREVYEQLRREVWTLRDELLGLKGEVGSTRAKLAVSEAARVSAEHRARTVADRLRALSTDEFYEAVRQRDSMLASRQWKVGRLVVGPMRRLRRIIAGH
jgi:SAM-dependent methyltransferase